MKGDPLLPAVLPRTQILIRQEVEVWPHRPDPDGYLLDQLTPGAFVWVRTPRGIRQLQLRLVRRARWWRGNRGRRFVVAHDRSSTCHRYWLSDVIRVQPRRRELTP